MCSSSRIVIITHLPCPLYAISMRPYTCSGLFVEGIAWSVEVSELPKTAETPSTLLFSGSAFHKLFTNEQRDELRGLLQYLFTAPATHRLKIKKGGVTFFDVCVCNKATYPHPTEPRIIIPTEIAIKMCRFLAWILAQGNSGEPQSINWEFARQNDDAWMFWANAIVRRYYAIVEGKG